MSDATGGFLDRRRAARLMHEQGLDALILTQPESIRHASGAHPGVASFWRRSGAAFLLVPSDAQAPLDAVVGDLQAGAFAARSGIADLRTHPIWVDRGRADPAAADISASIVAADRAAGRVPGWLRPPTYDLAQSLGNLAALLAERGLATGRLGLELGFIPASEAPRYGEALPRASLVDATDLAAALRAVKHPDELTLLVRAAELSAAGITDLLEALRPGLDAGAMNAVWRAGVARAAAARGVPLPGSDWAYIAVGGDGFAPGGPAVAGDLVKIDVGCVVEGYSSDMGRTAVIGPPSPAQVAVHDALRRSFEAGLAALRPGVPLGHVHAAVLDAMWRQGYSTYARGHVGHGLGAGVWSEDWPFIAAGVETAAEPGMVLALETPYYLAGLGGFIIEDQLLVTATGAEVIAPLARDLHIAHL